MERILNINITGMHCASCSALVTLTLKNRKGIKDISVNLITNSAYLVIDDQQVSDIEIIEIINNLGYKASVAEEGLKKKP